MNGRSVLNTIFSGASWHESPKVHGNVDLFSLVKFVKLGHVVSKLRERKEQMARLELGVDLTYYN